MENTDVNEYISYFTGIIADIKEGVMSNTLSSSNILSYLKHLPKRGINEGWPDTIYNLVDEGLKLLYKYAIDNSYVDNSVTYKLFLQDYNTLIQDSDSSSRIKVQELQEILHKYAPKIE